MCDHRTVSKYPGEISDFKMKVRKEQEVSVCRGLKGAHL